MAIRPLFPGRIGIWKCWFLLREENRSTRRKTLGAGTRTNNKLNPHMASTPRIEPELQCWEASALTTTPSLSSSSANCTAVGDELSPRLLVLYHTSNLFWSWWVCLADYAGNVLMKHQLWATGLTFAMFCVEKGAPSVHYYCAIPAPKLRCYINFAQQHLFSKVGSYF